MNPKLPTGARVGAAGKAALFYAGWYPRQWLPYSGVSLPDMDAMLAGHVRYAARTSRKLARRFFHSMARHGPALEREQVLLGRYVDVGTELFAIAATCSRAQGLIARGRAPEEILPLADFFCREARARVGQSFRSACRNNNRAGYRLARAVLDGQYAWLEDGILRQAKGR